MSSKKRTKRKNPSVKQQHINTSSRIADLLVRIDEEKTWVVERKFVRGQFDPRLDELRAILTTLPPHKNNLAVIRRVEKEFETLQAHINRIAQQRRRTLSFWVHLLIAVKVCVFMGAYFRLIPSGSLATHPTIYVTVASILLVVWISYFVVLEKSHDAFLHMHVLPYTQNFPKSTRTAIQGAFVSAFHLVSFTPLFTAVNVFPTFINPRWDTFLLKTGSMIIDIFTSSSVTAAVNVLALIPAIVFCYDKLKKRMGAK